MKRLKLNENIVNNIFDLVFTVLISSVALFLTRLNEAYFLESRLHHQFDSFNLLSKSVFNDFKFVIAISILIIPFAVFGKRNKKLLLVFFATLLFINGILTKVFLTNFNLLGSELLLLTWDEVFFVLKTEAPSITFNEIFIVFFYPLLFMVLHLKLIKSSNKNNLQGIKLLLILGYVIMNVVICMDYKHYFPKTRKFNNYDQYILVHNKLSFFLADLGKLVDQNQTYNSDKIEDDIDLYQSINSEFNYLNTEFPLMHSTPYSKNLSEYFVKRDSIKPNLVFIMVESLSGSFSGPNSHLGSFTPFLDSLGAESLYWENFLSNAERTYGVLPNTLSSAPYFNSFIQSTPYINHNSLIKELKDHGYSSFFSYGGDAAFTSMNSYLEYNNLDSILDIKSFDETSFTNHKKGKSGVHWGYDDESLFKQYLKHSKQFKEPYLSILLTLSMHSPYDMSENFTLEKATNYLGDLTIEQKKLFAGHEEKISSIAFTDQKLKMFFQEYRKRAEFNNTIFIIYGDHNIHGLPKRNELDVFHVPLLIYSTLLTKSGSFKGVSTHRDILPSILGLFEENYEMSFNEHKHWLGLGLDTAKEFRSKVITPLLLGSDKYANFICNNQVVFLNEVYQMDSLFNISREENKIKKEEIMNLYKGYINIENYILTSKKLYK